MTFLNSFQNLIFKELSDTKYPVKIRLDHKIILTTALAVFKIGLKLSISRHYLQLCLYIYF